MDFENHKLSTTMKKNIVFIAACLAMSFTTHAQDYNKEADISLKTAEGVQEKVEFYSPTIVRVTKFKSAEMPAKKSYPVILQNGFVKTSYSSNGDTITLSSANITVKVNKNNGGICFSTPQGRELMKEKEKSTSFTPFKDKERQTYSVGQTFILAKSEAIFGLGQRQNGVMNHRGQHIYLANGNTNICIPYFTSDKGYGLYWDNPSATNFDDDDNGLSFKSITGDLVDYYFMYKDGTQDGVMNCLRTLTGKSTCSRSGRWDTGSAANGMPAATSSAT
jgi:alpha-D-xyloside xylohydrolase